MDRHADRSGGGVEISFFFGDYVVAISCGCGCCWGGFWRLKFCFVLFFFFFFLCGDYFLWLWLVVDLVILVVGFLVDVVC